MSGRTILVVNGQARAMAAAEVWNKENGIKALVDSGINEVPDFYVKPPEERPSLQELSQISQENEIPVIDLANLPAAVAQLVDASENWGFFQVVNHGVDIQLMREMLAVAHEFFEMPLQDKMAYYGTDISSPVRYGTSSNLYKDKVLDWQDNLLHRFMPEHKDPHPWPQKPPSYRKIAEEYKNQVKRVGEQILRALSEDLGLAPDHLDEAFGKKQWAFRLNYYPRCPNPELVVGLSGHSDVGGLTILLQDSLGLQAKLPGSGWTTVKPIPGALVVNICDQLQILTNGRFKSIEHRAVVNSNQSRVSVALFYDPSSDVKVAPIAELLDSDNPPLYRPCVFGEYVENLYSKHLVGKAWVESQKIL